MARDDTDRDESLDTQDRGMDLPEREDTTMQEDSDGDEED